MKKSLPRSRQDNIVVQEMNGEVLIYDLKENKAFCLNETSALVWRLCNGENSVTDISQSIGKKLNSPANEDLVWLALDQLKKENLIANSEEVVPNYNGLSRREVIKKVGLGTMIALPLVSSLIAPVAANATSPTGGTAGAQAATCGPASTCAVAAAECARATCPQQTVANPTATVDVGACVCVLVTAAFTDPFGNFNAAVFSCNSVITCNTVTVTNNGVTLTSTTSITSATTGTVNL